MSDYIKLSQVFPSKLLFYFPDCTTDEYSQHFPKSGPVAKLCATRHGWFLIFLKFDSYHNWHIVFLFTIYVLCWKWIQSITKKFKIVYNHYSRSSATEIDQITDTHSQPTMTSLPNKNGSEKVRFSSQNQRWFSEITKFQRFS